MACACHHNNFIGIDHPWVVHKKSVASHGLCIASHCLCMPSQLLHWHCRLLSSHNNSVASHGMCMPSQLLHWHWYHSWVSPQQQSSHVKNCLKAFRTNPQYRWLFYYDAVLLPIVSSEECWCYTLKNVHFNYFFSPVHYCIFLWCALHNLVQLAMFLFILPFVISLECNVPILFASRTALHHLFFIEQIFIHL